jgi:hypothetical protein
MAILTVRERMENYGIFENGAQNIEKEDVEKSIEDLKKEVVDRAVANEPGAYETYQRIVVKEADSRVRIARAEMVEILKEFTGLMAKSIQKDNESYEDRECRVWLENGSLYLKYNNIQNLLESLR